MIEFETLFIRNFLSVASADVLLDKQGLVLIEGINQDDPSAKSNGAGKSSIVDAISWCLFGQTARGVTGDAVVNIKAGKETMVRVVVIVDGRRYRITRSRKHSKYKNRVELDEIVGADITSLTLGTDKLTQERINNLLGCTPDIFNASIYMGQEAMPDLPGMTDKQLKGILEQAMSLDKLDDALEVCKDRLATAQHEADSATSKLKMIADEIVVAENMVDKYTTMLRTDQSELTDARQELIDAKRDYAAKRADLNVRLKAKEDTLSKMDRVTMKEIMDEGKKADQAYWNIHVAPLIEKRGKAERLLDQNAADLRQTRREIDQLEQGGACPTCGHTTEADPEHRTAEMTKLKDQLSDLTAKRQRLGDALNQIARDLSTEQKTSAKVGDDHAALLMDKHSARLTVEREIDVLLTDVKHLEAFHKSAAATLEKIVATKERLCDQHQKDIDDQLADISDLKASHRKITVDAAAATERTGDPADLLRSTLEGAFDHPTA